ncbi:protein eva-1-like isoform X2 [Biomphalaria glabrata]|uniref:Protein eva-1-like isoform X2 n=1 Tax=Biomphalaria glabrata TaxID=6526 RepID=A0A9W3ACG7_BIOGL|nr:protein eva-1-like isoform X2 [Biomphalaria glabrata]
MAKHITYWIKVIAAVSLCVGSVVLVPITSETSDTQTAYACEGKKMTLTCGSEQKIQILSVMYGYPAGQTCPSDDHPFICQSHNKEKVVSICNGLSKCDITVDSNAFENPCRNPVWKLATVHYKCLEINAVFASEGMAMTLKCNRNERIKVVSGTYSRFPSDPNNVDVTEIISKRCNNQRSCTWEVRKSQIRKQSFKEQILAEVSYRCLIY